MLCRSGWRTTSGWASKRIADLLIEFVSWPLVKPHRLRRTHSEAIRARLKPCPNRSSYCLDQATSAKLSKSQMR